MDKVLIVNYAGLGMGGVEKYLHILMLEALKDGNRVIWITAPENVKNSVFRDVSENENIEKVYYKPKLYFFGLGHPKLNISKADMVTMVSFNQENYIWGEYFRKKYNCKSFDHFFILMNFFGASAYPEDRKEQFSYFKKRRKKLSEKIAVKLAKTDSLRAFDKKQLVYYDERYNLGINTTTEKCLKRNTKYYPLTEEELKAKAEERKKRFDIVACSRFDFPHKAFLVGLLKEFEAIHNKYPQTKLFIVGDGDSKAQLLNELETLSENAKSAIELTGTLNIEELESLHKNSQAAVSLAGCATSSAIIALPTLIARHNTYNCETYGFMHEAKSTLREDSGSPIFPFLEKIITCSNDEYVQIAKAGSDYLLGKKEYNPLYILKEKSSSNKPIATKWDIFVNAICFSTAFIYRKIIKK
ncbi:MAG: hypothetical protein MJ090_04500 [Clostridia bacterium]|nr:hypothetical protein [Clostridia bacterium]